MKGPTILTENMLRSLSTENSFERGRQYYRAGTIRKATRQGNNFFILKKKPTLSLNGLMSCR